MKIRTTPDNTGIAPRDCVWQAVDDDTYDGPDCPIGLGATEEEAIADLLEQLTEDAPMSTTALTACQLTAEPFSQCCCNCRFRLTDYKHCSIHGQPDGKCVCSQVKGYICVGFIAEGMGHSEWPEHSCGCELYDARVDHAAAIGSVEYASWFTP